MHIDCNAEIVTGESKTSVLKHMDVRFLTVMLDTNCFVTLCEGLLGAPADESGHVLIPGLGQILDAAEHRRFRIAVREHQLAKRPRWLLGIFEAAGFLVHETGTVGDGCVPRKVNNKLCHLSIMK